MNNDNFLGIKRALEETKEEDQDKDKIILKESPTIFNVESLIQSSSAGQQNKKDRKLFSDSYISIANFEKIAQVGEGTYGKVFKVKRKSLSNLGVQVSKYLKYNSTGNNSKLDYFALKMLIYEDEKDGFPITALREIKILQDLDHKNIVKLLDIIVSKPSNKNKKGNVYLLLEYIENDLSGILDRRIKLKPDGVKGILYQILQGVDYMHSKKGILHRDIKSSNILISSQGKVKIADFGLARYFSNKDYKLKRYYTTKVITLWYRPPELFFGENFYKESVDIWSIGILFWQLLINYAPIRSNSDLEQIEKILEVMGSIDEDSWPEVRQLKKYNQIIADKPRQEGKFKELIEE